MARMRKRAATEFDSRRNRLPWRIAMSRDPPRRPRPESRYSDYRVVEARDLDELVREVRDRIDDGWEPLGGVAIMPTGGPFLTGGYFYQALAMRA
jgi:hypothetical protein